MYRSLLVSIAAFATYFVEPVIGSVSCPGDLDQNGVVVVNELVTAVKSSIQGCPLPGPRFVDNGDGTISDNQTGLMWEKKVPGAACLHCGDRWFLWDEAAGEWLSRVNGAGTCQNPECTQPDPQRGTAGYSDWRLPSIAEWQTILDTCPPLNDSGSPDTECLGNIFGPDAAQHDFYFTNAVDETDPDAAWIAVFSFGTISLQRGSRHGDAVCHARVVRTIR
jgi:hypothetical protein